MPSTNTFDFETEADYAQSLSSQLQSLKQAVIREKAELKAAKEEAACAQEARDILQALAQAVQQKAHIRLAEVVSSCLSAVFQDPYTFKVEFERKRGRTQARLLFTRRGLTVDPMTASGGGVVDVAAFALRVSCLALRRPKLTHLLVLDEPFRFVSEAYQDNIRSMLEQLSRDLDLQIIMVTHNKAYETGLVHRL